MKFYMPFGMELFQQFREMEIFKQLRRYMTKIMFAHACVCVCVGGGVHVCVNMGGGGGGGGVCMCVWTWQSKYFAGQGTSSYLVWS